MLSATSRLPRPPCLDCTRCGRADPSVALLPSTLYGAISRPCPTAFQYRSQGRRSIQQSTLSCRLRSMSHPVSTSRRAQYCASLMGPASRTSMHPVFMGPVLISCGVRLGMHATSGERSILISGSGTRRSARSSARTPARHPEMLTSVRGSVFRAHLGESSGLCECALPCQRP